MSKRNIYNLKELDEALKNKVDTTSYAQILEKIRFRFKDVEHRCFWDADTYSKINIGNGVNYELMLICWENNQYSKIHKHSNSESFTYVLKGEITEKTYQPINGSGKFNLTGETVLIPRMITSLENKIENHHQLSNSYEGRSVSLHLYLK